MNDLLTKPERRTATFEYWGCNVAKHRHRTEEAAATCLKTRTGQGRPVQSIENLQRNVAMTIRVLNGETSAAVGRDIGVSTERVAQCMRKVLRRTALEYRDEIRAEDRKLAIFTGTIADLRRRKSYLIPWLNRYLAQYNA